MARQKRSAEERAAWWAVVKENRMLPMGTVLSSLAQDIPKAHDGAYMVGHWVWVTFGGGEYGDRETAQSLKLLGFVWVKRRGAWVHSCGYKAKRRHDLKDPREIYGTRHVIDEEDDRVGGWSANDDLPAGL